MPATFQFDWELPNGALQEPFAADLISTIKRETALQLFAESKISSGYGARMLGISEGELDEELATIDRLLDERREQ